MNWRNIKDSQPDELVDVLLACRDGNIVLGTTLHSEAVERRGQAYWIVGKYEICIVTSEVIGWIPLTEIPKPVF